MKPGKCRSCSADIYWFINPVSNKKTPLNIKDITIVKTDGTYHTGFENHFITCPQSKEWKTGLKNKQIKTKE